MGRSPCCDKMGLKKGPWTPDEDRKLSAYIQQHGHGNWHALPSKAGLQRCGKSCRLRWANYLRPDIKRGKFNSEEDETIIQLHAILGNRWSAIAAHLPKRTDNEIKNYWNTHLRKRLTRMGIDPVTHKPKNQYLGSSCGQSNVKANVSHLAQWESARLEAETRSKFDSSFNPTYKSLDKTAVVVPPPSTQLPRRQPCLDVLKAWAWTNPGKDISAPTSFNENLPAIANANHVGMYSGAWADDAGLANNYHQDDDLVKGIMGSSVEFHDHRIINPNPNDHSTQYSGNFSSLGFQSFIGGLTDVTNGPFDIVNVVGGCWGVLEDGEMQY